MHTFDTVRKFLTTQLFCVVSTIGDDGAPQSSYVAFSESPDGKIAFGTFADARKFGNIQREPRVSIVVSDGDVSVQIEGMARIVTGDDEARIREQHLAKNPASKKYAFDPRQRFVVVTPTWLRYTNLGTDPDTVEELRF